MLNAFDSGTLEVGGLMSVFAELEGGLGLFCVCVFFFTNLLYFYSLWEGK